MTLDSQEPKHVRNPRYICVSCFSTCIENDREYQSSMSQEDWSRGIIIFSQSGLNAHHSFNGCVTIATSYT